MRKFLFLVVLGLVVISGYSKAEIGLGLEGGVGIANLNSTPSVNDSKSGLVFGAFVEWEMGSFFYLQPEILFVPKGGATTALGVETKYHLNDMEIPLLLKLKLDVGPLAVYGLVGPALGFSTARQIEVAGLKTDSTAFKSSDFTFHAGAGMMLSLFPTLNFLLEARYITGLTNRSDSTAFTSVKTQTFAVMGGIAFIL